MPLPPLDENNTARLFIRYQTGGGTLSQEHTLSVRYNASLATPFDIMDGLAGVLDNGPGEAALFDGWQVLSAENQAAGSVVRLPVSVPASLLAVVGAGQGFATPSEQAREVRFIGRGLNSGRRVSLSLYGVATGAIAEQDFRFVPPGGTGLAALLTHIKGLALTGAAYTTIAGDPTNWYDYVNWQYNSHWETEQRA